MNTHPKTEAIRSRRASRTLAATALAATSLLCIGAGAPPASAQPPVRHLPCPRHFVHVIDNPYLPWIPGTRYVYKGHGSERGERDVVTVLRRTKTIVGIKATVVHDVVTSHGRLIEDTHDWYAQDRRGNVWYLGEKTKEYENGHVSTEGSWETGVDGARAGIAMLAHPTAGKRYRQEYLRGVAEDIGRVLDATMQIHVPVGHFKHVVLTKDTSALEPRVAELKFYAPGIGSVLELDVSPDRGTSVLVSVTN